MERWSRWMGALVCGGTILCGPVVAVDESTKGAEASEPRLGDLLEWLTELHHHSTALHNPVLPARETDAHLREIALLLAERGFSTQAEQALTLVVGSGAAAENGFADSLRLAQLRIESGQTKDALRIAQRLSTLDKTPEEMLRVAALHAGAGAPYSAIRILEEFLPQSSSEWSVETKLLLARCLWNSGAVEKSLRTIDDLLDDPDLSRSVQESLTLLRADCLFALGRFPEAREQYERAAQLALSSEKAAWTRLQLGNLAYREGELEAAIQHYREASESWPQTHYASQAAWLLQAAQRIALAEREALRHG